MHAFGFLPSRPGQVYTWALVFEPRDWWIGLYRDSAKQRLFICLVPCFPIIVSRLSPRHARAMT